MGDKFGEDLVSRSGQVCGGSVELFVVVARNPELNVLLAELGLEELTETLTTDYKVHASQLSASKPKC